MICGIVSFGHPLFGFSPNLFILMGPIFCALCLKGKRLLDDCTNTDQGWYNRNDENVLQEPSVESSGNADRCLRDICEKKLLLGSKLGAVTEAVGQDDVFVEVVGASRAVAFDLIDHLADGKDGGRRRVGLHL